MLTKEKKNCTKIYDKFLKVLNKHVLLKKKSRAFHKQKTLFIAICIKEIVYSLNPSFVKDNILFWKTSQPSSQMKETKAQVVKVNQ